MTSAVTWAQVHAGDTLRGADGRDYLVASIERLGRWVGSGQLEYLVGLEGGRRLRRSALEPAPLLRTADDRADFAAAYAAFLSAGMAPDLLGETMELSDPAQSTARREAPTGKWGWYKLPNPTWSEPGDPTEVLLPRVSTIKKTLVDDFGLTAWKLRMAVKGLALRPDLIARAAASDVDGDRGGLDQIVTSAMEKAEASAAANYGTAVHKFCERLDEGESIAGMGVPDRLVPLVERYAATLKAHGLTVLPDLSERTIVNAEHEYAGTWDRIVRDRAGALYVLDVKTGKDLSYAWLENAVQLAMYAHGEFMCTRDFTAYERPPAIDQAKGFILHLPLEGDFAGRAQIYGVPLDKGWAAATRSLAVRKMRTEAKGWNWLVQPETPADVLRLHMDRADTLEALLEVSRNARARGLWTEELQDYGVARYDRMRVDAATQQQLADLYAELHPAGRWTAELQDAGMARMAALTAARGGG